jgi:hypothetical protein
VTSAFVRLADVAAVRPSPLPVAGEGDGRAIRLRYFPGALFGPPISITLGETELSRLRRFQLICLTTLLVGGIGLFTLAWQIVVAVGSFAASRPVSWQMPSSVNALFVIGTMVGAVLIKRHRPSFFPIRVPGRSEVRLEHLDPQGAESWMRLNEGLVRLE